MLVGLRIRWWNGSVQDKKVSQEVAETHNVSETVGRYRKDAVTKSVLAPIQAVVGEARKHTYMTTLPWSDVRGLRIRPAKGFVEYKSRVAGFEETFYSEVGKVLPRWDDIVEAEQARLKSLWREEDYPTTQEIGDRFEFKLIVSALPNLRDWRIDLSDEHAERIRSEAIERERATMHGMMASLWNRLYTPIMKMADRLSDTKVTRLHTTLVTNIQDVIGVLPELNLTGDPELARLVDMASRRLCKLNPDALRKSEAVRKLAARDASRIRDEISNTLQRVYGLTPEQAGAMDSEGGE